MQANITNLNTDTLLLDSGDEMQPLNLLSTVPTAESVLDYLQILLDEHPNMKEVIHNVDDLPSIETAFQYLHLLVGFLTKAIWIEAIQNVKYLT